MDSPRDEHRPDSGRLDRYWDRRQDVDGPSIGLANAVSAASQKTIRDLSVAPLARLNGPDIIVPLRPLINL